MMQESSTPSGGMDVDVVVSVTDREPSFLAQATARARSLTCVGTSGEAFAAKHLSDMGEETEDFTVFTWPLKEYRRMEKRALSPEFSCGGHKW